MIYLITQLAGWLILTALFAALAGWSFAGLQSRPAEEHARRERERLTKDVLRFAGGEAGDDTAERELEALRARVDVETARAAAAERAIETARGESEETKSRLAEIERAIAAPGESVRALEVEASPAPRAETDLQAWRLRYFEQRVKFLENGARAEKEAPAPEDGRSLEWRARVAEARAAHLEDELRNAERAPEIAPLMALAEAPETAAFAADVETDALLRWRMLYLERRAAHLQEKSEALGGEMAAHAAPAPVEGPDPAQWKWRARYLEARLRHLEARAAPAPAPAMLDDLEEPEASAPAPAAVRERPPALPGARGGASDDFTLIEGVSALQQSTLNSLGVFHFDQIAAWSVANVAWVDAYLRLRGRIDEEEWVTQAQALAREGVIATRRLLVEEEA